MPPVPEDRLAIGRRIKQVRLSKDKTLQELANASGISVGYLSEVERGLSAVTLEKLSKIARALGVSVQFLAEGREDEPARGGEVRIPAALSQAAEQLGLSHRATLLLLQGKESLQAKRSRDGEGEWNVEDWMEFYSSVKDYLPSPQGVRNAKNRGGE